MVKELAGLGMEVMVSFWPFSVPGSRSHDTLVKNGWAAVKTSTGVPQQSHGGVLVDATIPEAREYKMPKGVKKVKGRDRRPSPEAGRPTKMPKPSAVAADFSRAERSCKLCRAGKGRCHHRGAAGHLPKLGLTPTTPAGQQAASGSIMRHRKKLAGPDMRAVTIPTAPDRPVQVTVIGAGPEGLAAARQDRGSRCCR